MQERVEAVISISLQEFNDGWQQWLEQQRELPLVKAMLEDIPAITGEILLHTDSSGVHSVKALYRQLNEDTPQSLSVIEGNCILKHDYIGPFDTEFEVTDDYEDIKECRTDDVVHVIESTYAPGDRIFVALDFEGADFHQPIRLHAERLYIP